MVKRGQGESPGGGSIPQEEVLKLGIEGRAVRSPGGRACQEREQHAQMLGVKWPGLFREQQAAGCGPSYQVPLVCPVLNYFISRIKPIALYGDFCRGRSWCL